MGRGHTTRNRIGFRRCILDSVGLFSLGVNRRGGGEGSLPDEMRRDKVLLVLYRLLIPR